MLSRTCAKSKIISRAFSTELAFDKYPFLAKLGLKKDNLGCWNGKK
jgi:hypothetical protein